jgi:hypothetical protein
MMAFPRGRNACQTGSMRSDHDWLIDALRAEEFFPPSRLILEHGRPFQPVVRPPDVDVGKKGCCYANAFRLASERSALRYVEGFATVRESRTWIFRHAWCVDGADRVVDASPGWGDSALPRALRGIVLPLAIAEPFATEESRGTLETMSNEIEALAKLLGLRLD